MKFSGRLGFYVGDVETSPDIFVNEIIERPYTGDVIRDNRRFMPVSGEQNDKIKLDNQISVVSDLFLQENWHSIRYVIWKGVKIKVNDVQIGVPRCILSIGGVYDGETEIRTQQDTP